MQNQVVKFVITSCALIFAAKEHCFARPMKAAFSRGLNYVVRTTPPMASMSYWEPSGIMSPDGRWLAYFNARSEKRDRVVFYDLIRSRHWVMDAGRVVPNSYSTRILSWRRDSRACAVGAAGGWKIAWPATRKTRRIARSAPGGESCAAWSPRTNRLAMFESFLGNGLYRVWHGKRLSKGIEWRKAVGFPQGEERAWQCEWSPDEKLLLFRFYGHAERDRNSSGHTVVINPRTARPRFDWGAEAGPAQWLDNSRLIFNADEEGLGLFSGPMVAKPVAHQSNPWLKNAVAWTLSPRRDTIWALTTKGHLCRSSTRRKQWQIVRRNAVSAKALRRMSPSLSLSPRGDMVAFCHTFGGKDISLVSTSPKRPWAISWQAPAGKVEMLGWAAGKSLPLLELQRNDQTPAVVIQLTK
jgi:hypothetical protein